jgi:hypothetical protein
MAVMGDERRHKRHAVATTLGTTFAQGPGHQQRVDAAPSCCLRLPDERHAGAQASCWLKALMEQVKMSFSTDRAKTYYDHQA